MHQRKRSYFFVVVAIVAAFAGLLFGYDTGVMSGAILFINNQYHLSAEMNGWVVSSVLFGAVGGAIISGRVSDRFGRKNLLIAIAVLFIVASIVSAIAQTIAWLVVGRILIGIAIGVASYTAPLYISEIAPAKHRGALVSLNQLAVTIGILISYLVDYLCAFHPDTGWRYMLGFGAVPALLLLLGMIALPYSPRWLVAKGNMPHALEILRRIRTGHHAEVDAELQAIKSSLEVQKGGWRQLMSGTLRPALVVALSLAVIQQFVGINTILYYAPTIFSLASHPTPMQAILATVPVGVVLVIFTLISLPLIDVVGRRPLLIVGLVGMSIGLLILVIAFHGGVAGSNHFLTTIGMLLYIACFAFSLGPIMWLMIAEVFPLSIRGLGTSLASAVNWGSNMLVTLTFLSLTQLLGTSGTFGLYLILSLISLVFVIFMIPETKGVSLEQIESHLYAGRSSRRIGQ
tara:strand:+ start:1187 stop:2563 length:1377 start_codon:yes stop_codon:yes gene_type:complete